MDFKFEPENHCCEDKSSSEDSLFLEWSHMIVGEDAPLRMSIPLIHSIKKFENNIQHDVTILG